MSTSGSREAQRGAALSSANEVRLARAALKRRVAAGEVSLARALASPETQSARIADVVRWKRRWGATKTRRFLGSLRVGESTRVVDVTDRLRARIALVVDGLVPEDEAGER